MSKETPKSFEIGNQTISRDQLLVIIKMGESRIGFLQNVNPSSQKVTCTTEVDGSDKFSISPKSNMILTEEQWVRCAHFANIKSEAEYNTIGLNRIIKYQDVKEVLANPQSIFPFYSRKIVESRFGKKKADEIFMRKTTESKKEPEKKPVPATKSEGQKPNPEFAKFCKDVTKVQNVEGFLKALGKLEIHHKEHGKVKFLDIVPSRRNPNLRFIEFKTDQNITQWVQLNLMTRFFKPA